MKRWLLIKKICFVGIAGVFLTLFGLGKIMASNNVIEYDLDNGLKVFLVQDSSTSMASIRTYVRAGSVDEEGYGLGGGLSHYLEHIVAGGTTEKRSEKDYETIISNLGGAYNAYTTTDHTSYYINTTSEHIDQALDVLYEWMFDCEFKKSEFERERDVIIKEIEKNKANIYNQFYYLGHANFYKYHPLRFPVIGYLENFKSVSRKALMKYYTDKYVASNMVLVVGGNFNVDDVKSQIQVSFGKEKQYLKPPAPYFKEPLPFSRRYIEKEADTNVTRYSMRFGTVDLVSSDLYPLDLLEFILANGEDSIMYKTLVEEEKLAYSVRCSSYTPSITTGYFEVSLEIDRQNIEKAKKRVNELIQDIKKGRVDTRRLNRARKQKLSEDIFSIVSIEDKVSRVGQAYVYGYTKSFFDDYVRLFKNVKKSDIVRVANQYLDFERIVETVMVPRTKSEEVADGEKRLKTDQSVEEPKMTLPKKVVLDNGVRVLFYKEDSLPRVYTKVFLAGGIRAETHANNGIGWLTADLLGKESQRYSKQKIKTMIEDRGASLGGSLGNNTLYYNLDCLADDYFTLFPVFSDSFLRPKFIKSDLVESKRQAVKSIEKRQDTWSEYGFYYFRKKFFKDHSYGLSFKGEKETISEISVSEVNDYYNRLLNPREMVITVFGDFDEEFALKMITKYFGKLSVPTQAYNPNMQLTRDLHNKVKEEEVEIPQDVSAVFVGYDGLKLKDTDELLKMELVDSVLSGMSYPGGRLHPILRGKGMVYLVHGVNFFGIEDGYFLVYALTSKDKYKNVKKIIFDQIESLRDKKISKKEFELAKSQLVYHNKERLASLEDYAVITATDELYGRGYDFAVNLLDNVDELKPVDVQDTIKKYFKFPQTYVFQK